MADVEVNREVGASVAMEEQPSAEARTAENVEGSGASPDDAAAGDEAVKVEVQEKDVAGMGDAKAEEGTSATANVKEGDLEHMAEPDDAGEAPDVDTEKKASEEEKASKEKKTDEAQNKTAAAAEKKAAEAERKAALKAKKEEEEEKKRRRKEEEAKKRDEKRRTEQEKKRKAKEEKEAKKMQAAEEKRKAATGGGKVTDKAAEKEKAVEASEAAADPDISAEPRDVPVVDEAVEKSGDAGDESLGPGESAAPQEESASGAIPEAEARTQAVDEQAVTVKSALLTPEQADAVAADGLFEGDVEYIMKLKADEVEALKAMKNLDSEFAGKFDDKFLMWFVFARKLDPERAMTLLKANKQWRDEYEVDSDLEIEALRPLIMSGMTFLLPDARDKESRAVCYIFAKNMVTSELTLKKQVNFLWWSTVISFEAHIDNQREGSICIEDFTGASFSDLRKTFSGGDVGKKTLEFTQDCLPGRLRKIYLIHAPWYVRLLLPLVKPFMKKRLAEKVESIGLSDLSKLVDPSNMLKSSGGTRDFDYQEWAGAEIEKWKERVAAHPPGFRYGMRPETWAEEADKEKVRRKEREEAEQRKEEEGQEAAKKTAAQTKGSVGEGKGKGRNKGKGKTKSAAKPSETVLNEAGKKDEVEESGPADAHVPAEQEQLAEGEPEASSQGGKAEGAVGEKGAVEETDEKLEAES